MSIIPTTLFLAGGARMMATLFILRSAIAPMKTLRPQIELAHGLIEAARTGALSTRETPHHDIGTTENYKELEASGTAANDHSGMG